MLFRSSRDRQMYLLVPEHHAIRAKDEIKKYMERLLNLRPSTVLNYTPSDEVITNVGFLKTMSTSNLWNTSTSEFPTNPHLKQPSVNPNISPSPTQERDDTSLGTASQQTSQTPTFSKFNYARRMTSSDDHTMATTQLSLSATQSSKFDEMEAAILQQQAEYKTVLTRFDQVEDQALRTMAVCQASSKSILDLRKESLKQMSTLRQESLASLQQIRDESAQHQRDLQNQLLQLQRTMTSFIRDSKSRSKSSSSESASSAHAATSDDDDSMSTSDSHDTLAEMMDPTPSPPNTTVHPYQPRLSRKKKRNSTQSKSTDQASAQYTSDSAPDGLDP